MKPLPVLVVFGTRPEAIKMVPVIQALGSRPERYDVKVCVTAQHRQMLDQVLEMFGVTPDFDLNLMRADQDLYDVTCRALMGLRDVLRQCAPGLVLVQGDTTTTAAASLAAFYARVPVGHVEAGLRTFNKHAPFPEEVNRRITGLLADLHFVPTERGRRNLLDEHVAEESIWVTGNTSIDALRMAQRRMGLEEPPPGRRLLVTAHRRESFGNGIRSICQALRILAERYRDLEIVFPVHPNPNAGNPARELLSGLPNVRLSPPLDYFEFVRQMHAATLVLSDSGGVQEEAPTFGKPVLVMRDTTERVEAVEAGTARLIGTDRERIVAAVVELLESEAAYAAMAQARNPYGDGTAALKIEAAIHAWRSAQAVGARSGA